MAELWCGLRTSLSQGPLGFEGGSVRAPGGLGEAGTRGRSRLCVRHSSDVSCCFAVTVLSPAQRMLQETREQCGSWASCPRARGLLTIFPDSVCTGAPAIPGRLGPGRPLGKGQDAVVSRSDSSVPTRGVFISIQRTPPTPTHRSGAVVASYGFQRLTKAGCLPDGLACRFLA